LAICGSSFSLAIYLVLLFNDYTAVLLALLITVVVFAILWFIPRPDRPT